MIPNPGSAVLGRNATGLEQSMADADAERLIAINAEAVTEVWDAYKISAANLPYLAWAEGVNYWDDDWRELTKRNWVYNQLKFKALRGTLDGIRMAVDYAGRDVSPFGYRVISAVRPPQQIFGGPSPSKADREKWLELLPQLRVWLYQERGVAPKRKMFCGSNSMTRDAQGIGRRHGQSSIRFCLGGGFPLASTALSRLHRRAKWVVGGVETSIPVAQIGSRWEIHLPGKAGRGMFCGLPISKRRFPMPSTAKDRVLTIQPKPTLPWRNAATPSLDMVTVAPDYVVVNGAAKRAQFFCGQCIGRKFLPPSTAQTRVYQRFAVNDGSIGPHRSGPVVQFMGRGRLGFPKFTCWLRVSVSSKRKRSAFVVNGVLGGRRRFLIPHDPRPLQRVRAAVLAASRGVDRIMLDIGPKAQFIAGGRPVLAGVDTVIVGRPAPLE